jgi:hypothetical protein
LNYSSIAGSSISSNTLTLSLTNASTQNTQIYQVATTNPTTSYTVIQASHVSTGTTNNALALNPSGGNVGVGTTAPLTSFHILNSTADASSQLDNTPTSHILLRNTKAGASPYSMGLGVDQTTGAGYINAAGNGAIQPVCLQTRGGSVGIGTTAPAALLNIMGTATTSAANTSIVLDNSLVGGVTTAGGAVGSLQFNNSGITGASIQCVVDGAGANNNGALTFNTRSDFVTNTEKMRITRYGDVGIGTTTTSAKLHITGPVANASLLQCWMTTSQVLAVTTTGNSANASWNATDTVLRVSRDNGSGRSINAGGTINANGADYAEYMTKDSDFSALKGDILGVLPSGKLTNQFDAAIHFLLKSTNPCMVGGDVWGTEEIVGERPKEPAKEATEEEKAAHAAALAAWEARLEAERQKVDRMAFAGQVPVNILGATPGNYIIPLRNADGSIGIAAVSSADMSFSQYQIAVGRVISILADGRANVIVKAV